MAESKVSTAKKLLIKSLEHLNTARVMLAEESHPAVADIDKLKPKMNCLVKKIRIAKTWQEN